ARHHAAPADAYVFDPRSILGLGHAVLQADALLPRRLADVAGALHALVLCARQAGVPPEPELLRAPSGDVVLLLQPRGRARRLRRRIDHRGLLRRVVPSSDPASAGY